MEMIAEGQQIERQLAASAASAASTAGAAQPGEYLAYQLGDEEYGVDILCVREIRSYETPTRIPNAPAFVKGVINLRGIIIPLVDLRMKLGCAQAEYTVFTAVIVLAVHDRVVGVVVDSVLDVINLDAKAIQAPPQMAGVAGGPGFVTGVATVEGRLLLLVDMQALLADESRYEPREAV